MGGRCSFTVGAIVGAAAKTSRLRAGLFAICAVLLAAFGGPAQAQPFTQFIGFGDSTVDSGWYFTHTHDKNPTRRSTRQRKRSAAALRPRRAAA
jgi:hypothetical protein